jgi:hypothetical protein
LLLFDFFFSGIWHLVSSGIWYPAVSSGIQRSLVSSGLWYPAVSSRIRVVVVQINERYDEFNKEGNVLKTNEEFPTVQYFRFANDDNAYGSLSLSLSLSFFLSLSLSFFLSHHAECTHHLNHDSDKADRAGALAVHSLPERAHVAACANAAIRRV